METDRLRQFKTVVDAGGILKASELLGITGGGLSKSIKTLELELGYGLFLQKGRGLELTEEGQELYKRLDQFLEALESLTDFKASPLEEIEKPFRFATFEVFSTYFLANFIKTEIPYQACEILEAIPGRMEQLTAQGRAHIALTYEPIPTPGVEFLKASTISMGLYGKSSFAKYAAEDLPFIIPIQNIEGTPSGVKGLDGWPDHLFQRKIKYRVEMMETALQLASQGLGVVFIPDFVADFFNSQVKSNSQLTCLKPPGGFKKVKRPVFIIKKSNSEEDALIKKLAKYLRSL